MACSDSGEPLRGSREGEFIRTGSSKGQALSDVRLSRAAFSTTNWSLVRLLRDQDGSVTSVVLEELSRRYWPPVYAYCRKRGYDSTAAADLTQAFFSEVVIRRQLFDQADAKRGRMRTLIRSALNNFLIDQARLKSPPMNDPKLRLSVDDLQPEDRMSLTSHDISAEEAFDRRWAVSVLEEALSRCAKHFESMGKPQHWNAFQHCVLQPAITGNERPALKVAAIELGFESAAQLAAVNQIVRRRVQLFLREAAAESAETADDQDSEYQHLLKLLGM